MMMNDLDPRHQNVLAAIATIAYVKIVIAGCDFVVSYNLIPSKVSRKIIHIAAGSWLIFWPLFTTDDSTWRLNILVPAIYSVQLFVKGAIFKDKEDVDVKTMSRTGNPSELLLGPLFFTMIMNMVGILCFRKKEAIHIMACLGFGDGIAPLIGGSFPFGQYPTYPFGTNDKKTLSGSLGFFVASLVGYYALSFAAIDASENFESVAKVAAACAVAEGVTGTYDNIFIALTAYVASEYL
jgi:dolichol kinase